MRAQLYGYENAGNKAARKVRKAKRWCRKSQRCTERAHACSAGEKTTALNTCFFRHRQSGVCACMCVLYLSFLLLLSPRERERRVKERREGQKGAAHMGERNLINTEERKREGERKRAPKVTVRNSSLSGAGIIPKVFSFPSRCLSRRWLEFSVSVSQILFLYFHAPFILVLLSFCCFGFSSHWSIHNSTVSIKLGHRYCTIQV